MHERTNTTRRDTDRAQTTLDFAIAMGVFLLAVAFVFTFIPSLTAPFLDGTQDHSAVADRTASHLTEGGLGDPNRPYVVDEACATPFFDNDEEYCGFEGDTLNERLGLSDRHQVAISMIRLEDGTQQQVCRSETGGVTHEGTGNCDEDHVYTVGDDPATASSTTVSRRVVTLDDCEFDEPGCDVTLLVEVW